MLTRRRNPPTRYDAETLASLRTSSSPRPASAVSSEVEFDYTKAAVNADEKRPRKTSAWVDRWMSQDSDPTTAGAAGGGGERDYEGVYDDEAAYEVDLNAASHGSGDGGRGRGRGRGGGGRGASTGGAHPRADALVRGAGGGTSNSGRSLGSGGVLGRKLSNLSLADVDDNSDGDIQL